MIKREKYMEPIREFYDGDLIKVITGIPPPPPPFAGVENPSF